MGPVIDELGQHVGQVGFGIDAVQLAGLDQRGEHRSVFRSFVAAGKQSIFSVQSNRPHVAPDGIGLDLDAAVVEEAHQPIAMVEAISDDLGDRRATTCVRVLSSQVFSAAARGFVFSCRTRGVRWRSRRGSRLRASRRQGRRKVGGHQEA